MAFVAGLLLFYVPEEPAFQLFCRLLRWGGVGGRADGWHRFVWNAKVAGKFGWLRSVAWQPASQPPRPAIQWTLVRLPPPCLAPSLRSPCRSTSGPNLRRLYLPGMEGLKAELRKLDFLMERRLPSLTAHLNVSSAQ